MYAFRTSIGPVDLAFTDRFGGVSLAPYESLNLSISGEDDEAAKAENHRRLLADFAPDAATCHDVFQVHGRAVHVVGPPAVTTQPDGESADSGGPLHPAQHPVVRGPEADAVVTAQVGTPIMVRAADCVPVILADPQARVVGAAHAGRKGVEADVVTAAVDAMRALGADRIQAWIGQHICGRCYEVPEQMRDQVAGQVPAARSQTSWGTPALDLGAGVASQLGAAGVEVHDVARCTFESPDLYSYRREGAACGRMVAIVRIRP